MPDLSKKRQSKHNESVKTNNNFDKQRADEKTSKTVARTFFSAKFFVLSAAVSAIAVFTSAYSAQNPASLYTGALEVITILQNNLYSLVPRRRIDYYNKEYLPHHRRTWNDANSIDLSYNYAFFSVPSNSFPVSSPSSTARGKEPRDIGIYYYYDSGINTYFRYRQHSTDDTDNGKAKNQSFFLCHYFARKVQQFFFVPSLNIYDTNSHHARTGGSTNSEDESHEKDRVLLIPHSLPIGSVTVPLNAVHDGIRDCCDGSDEWSVPHNENQDVDDAACQDIARQSLQRVQEKKKEILQGIDICVNDRNGQQAQAPPDDQRFQSLIEEFLDRSTINISEVKAGMMRKEQHDLRQHSLRILYQTVADPKQNMLPPGSPTKEILSILSTKEVAQLHVHLKQMLDKDKSSLQAHQTVLQQMQQVFHHKNIEYETAQQERQRLIAKLESVKSDSVRDMILDEMRKLDRKIKALIVGDTAGEKAEKWVGLRQAHEDLQMYRHRMMELFDPNYLSHLQSSYQDIISYVLALLSMFPPPSKNRSDAFPQAEKTTTKVWLDKFVEEYYGTAAGSPLVLASTLGESRQFFQKLFIAKNNINHKDINLCQILPERDSKFTSPFTYFFRDLSTEETSSHPLSFYVREKDCKGGAAEPGDRTFQFTLCPFHFISSREVHFSSQSGASAYNRTNHTDVNSHTFGDPVLLGRYVGRSSTYNELMQRLSEGQGQNEAVFHAVTLPQVAINILQDIFGVSNKPLITKVTSIGDTAKQNRNAAEKTSEFLFSNKHEIRSLPLPSLDTYFMRALGQYTLNHPVDNIRYPFSPIPLYAHQLKRQPVHDRTARATDILTSFANFFNYPHGIVDVHEYTNGEACWGGPRRTVKVVYVCGSHLVTRKENRSDNDSADIVNLDFDMHHTPQEYLNYHTVHSQGGPDHDQIIALRENGKCEYEVLVRSPSACCDPSARHREGNERTNAMIWHLEAVESWWQLAN